jgi:hypothetical protein
MCPIQFETGHVEEYIYIQIMRIGSNLKDKLVVFSNIMYIVCLLLTADSFKYHLLIQAFYTSTYLILYRQKFLYQNP